MKKTTPKKDGNPTREAFNGGMGDRPLHERIAEQAYAFYEKRGQRHGNDLDDWLEAERTILSEPNASEATPPLKPEPASRAKSTRKRSSAQKAS